MKPSKQIIYRCAGCGSACNTLHEIIFGNGNRPVCVEYNIQVPLCYVCHMAAHGQSTKHASTPLYRFKKRGQAGSMVLDQSAIARFFCDKILKVDYWDALRGVKDKSSRHLLEPMREKCENKIKGRQITLLINIYKR